MIGSSLDGPEWYEQPNTNMFNIEGPALPDGTGVHELHQLLQAARRKRSVKSPRTPPRPPGETGDEQANKYAGLTNCDLTVVPLGGVSFTTYALSFKSAGCQLAFCSCVLASSLAVSTSLKQEGLSDAKVVYLAGASNQVNSNPADIAAATGAYFANAYTFSTPAGKAMLDGLKKYDPAYTGGVPDLGAADGWEVANLTIEGLQVAGQNPTRSSFITNLRKVSDWTDNGLSVRSYRLQAFRAGADGAL